jgi:YgiT-type zinc finger domain-containing protein
MFEKLNFNSCEYCGYDMVERKVKRFHWCCKRLYLIENVPAQVCKMCGGRFYHAQVLDEIDLLLASDHEVMERIEVEVVVL